MLQQVGRLCFAALALSGASLLSAQTAAATDAQLKFVDANLNPLPPDFIAIRNSTGHVVLPTNETGGTFLFSDVGRKVTFEFTPRGFKTRSIDLMLENAPKVFVTMMVDPTTGQIKSIEQKPFIPHSNPRSHLRNAATGGSVPLGGGGPPNDNCGAATPIFNGATAFSTVGATTDGPSHSGVCQFDGQTYEDIWFTYNSPCTGSLVVTTCGTADYDTDLVVYDGIVCPPTTRLGCNDDTAGCAGFSSSLTVPVVAGNNYLIRIGGFGSGDEGSGIVNLSCVGAAANNECAGAPEVPCNSSTVFSNSGNTTNPTDPNYSCRFGGPGQGFGTSWYKFVAASASAVIDTNGSLTGDTMLAIYSGTCGSLVEIGCDDDSGLGLLSQIAIGTLTPGNTYYIQVAGFGASNVGTNTLNIACAVGPAPGDDCADALTVNCGGSATFDNTLFSTDPLDPLYSCAFFGPQQGIGTGWLTFVATATSARVDTNLSFAFDTLLAVYDGTCGSFTELACSDDDGVGLLSDLCVTGLTVGNTYYIQASSFDAFSTGEITVSVTCPCPAPPTNDECEAAIDLGALPTSVTFDNSLATDDIAVPCELFSGPFQNVWYRVAGTGTTLTATTCNGGTIVSDTKISVFCGECLAPLCVAGNDDDCPGGGPIFASTVSWCSQVGASYLITVGNFSPDTAPGTIQLDVSDTGSSCTADVVCLPQGACCLEDGSCVVTTGDDCAAQGGTYNGDGSECTSNSVADGGFEAGPFGGVWTEFSTNFGTPVCDSSCGFGGGTGPNSGNFWSWFGGIPAFEQGSMEQNVTIPASATTLDFFLEIPVSSGNGVDFVRVLIDGIQVFEAFEDDPVHAGVGYDQVSIPIGAFADGGVHTLTFESTITGDDGAGNPAFTNFFVDDVSISSVVINCDTGPDCFTVDFQNGDSGPLVNGQQIDTEFSGDFSIASAGANAGPAIFNTATGGPNDPSQDRDLLVNRGNALILQNSQVPGLSGGVFTTPNDDQDGGSLIFVFNQPVTATSIVLIDIDVGSNQASSVVIQDSTGRSRTYTVPSQWTEDLLINGPPAWRTLDLTTLAPQVGFASIATASENAGFNPDDVIRVRVNLGSSGAVDDLSYCKE